MAWLGRTALYCYSVITVVIGCIPLFKWEERWMRAALKKLCNLSYASWYVIALRCLTWCLYLFPMVAQMFCLLDSVKCLKPQHINKCGVSWMIRRIKNRSQVFIINNWPRGPWNHQDLLNSNWWYLSYLGCQIFTLAGLTFFFELDRSRWQLEII